MIKRPIPLLSVYWNENYNHKIVSGERLVTLKDRGKKRNDKAPYPFIICFWQDRGKKRNDKASIYYYFFKRITSTIFLQKIIDSLTTRNNLILMIYCKIIIDITFISFFKRDKKHKVMINYYYGDFYFFFNKIYVRPHCENR